MNPLCTSYTDPQDSIPRLSLTNCNYQRHKDGVSPLPQKVQEALVHNISKQTKILSYSIWNCAYASPILHNSGTHSIIHSRYLYRASSSPLLLRGAPDYSIDTVSELTRRSATGS